MKNLFNIPEKKAISEGRKVDLAKEESDHKHVKSNKQLKTFVNISNLENKYYC